MSLSTGDFSVGFTRVLHDGWKGGGNEISRGQLYLDGCSSMLLVGKRPPFRAHQLRVPCGVQEPLAPGRQTEEH